MFVLAWLLACAGHVDAAQLEIVVPAYFYPSSGSDWNDLNAAAATVPITAIMNPFNGPGNSLDANYVAAVNALRAAGGRVIGYIHTSYTDRPLEQVLHDIDRYEDWYDIDGIFVDEMANTGPAERLNYYRDIYNHVKSIDANWEVMGNPGTSTIEEYLTWPTADRLMVFENVGASYPGASPSAWNFSYPSSHFVHLVHTEPSAANMQNYVELAVHRNAGGIYITDDVMSNPWDRLPGYWPQLVEAVAKFNADFNRDGFVDAADYVVWRRSFGLSGDALAADGNGDRVVDADDLVLWQKYFGAVPGGAATGLPPSPLPEPASLILISMGLAPVVIIPRAFSARLIAPNTVDFK